MGVCAAIRARKGGEKMAVKCKILRSADERLLEDKIAEFLQNVEFVSAEVTEAETPEGRANHYVYIFYKEREQ